MAAMSLMDWDWQTNEWSLGAFDAPSGQAWSSTAASQQDH